MITIFSYEIILLGCGLELCLRGLGQRRFKIFRLQGWKLMSSSHCQELGQLADLASDWLFTLMQLIRSQLACWHNSWPWLQFINFHPRPLTQLLAMTTVHRFPSLDVVGVDEGGLHRDPDQGPEPVPGQHQATHKALKKCTTVKRKFVPLQIYW